MKTIKKNLVPTDFSELWFAALEYAESLVAIYDAKIYFLHVVDNEPTLANVMVDLNSETILRNVEENATGELLRIMYERVNNGENVIPFVCRGNAFKEIVKFSEEKNIDIIVMATHGLTGLAHVLLGSVTEKVVRHSSIPVLTIKPEARKKKFSNKEYVEEQLHFIS